MKKKKGKDLLFEFKAAAVVIYWPTGSTATITSTAQALSHCVNLSSLHLWTGSFGGEPYGSEPLGYGRPQLRHLTIGMAWRPASTKFTSHEMFKLVHLHCENIYFVLFVQQHFSSCAKSVHSGSVCWALAAFCPFSVYSPCHHKRQNRILFFELHIFSENPFSCLTVSRLTIGLVMCQLNIGLRLCAHGAA